MSETADDSGWRPALMFGTHLYALPADADLDEISSFPTEDAREIDAVASSKRDFEDREDEFERAASRFRDRMDEVAAGEKAVVAIGEGQRFRIAPAQTFLETFGSASDCQPSDR